MHERMPVILMPRDYSRWLSRGDGGRPQMDLLRPYEAALMHVSARGCGGWQREE
jgi:putative SOS response-associated peptidase YedK